MDKKRIAIISPLVDHYRPDLSDAEKAELTIALRPLLRIMFDIYCRMDREGLLEPDSLETESDDIVESVNQKNI